MVRLLPAATGLAIVAACGLVQGLWTDRWSLSHEPGVSASRLAEVPKTIGDWETLREPPLPGDEVAIGEIAGYLNRGYVNRRTGKGLWVLCVCGRPGPIGQHSPMVCFGGQGFELAKPRHRISFANSEFSAPAEFWVGDFRNNSAAEPRSERLYWSWSSTGAWEAADSPRLVFSHFQALYKLYIIHKMSRPDETAEEDPAPDFIKLFIPQLQKVLFTGP
jgi:hypothetical protein